MARKNEQGKNDKKKDKAQGKPTGQQKPAVVKVAKPKGPPADYRPKEVRLREVVSKAFSPLTLLNDFPIGKSFQLSKGTKDETSVFVTEHEIAPGKKIAVIKVLWSKNPVLDQMVKKDIHLTVGAFRAKDENFVKKERIPQDVFDRQVELRRVLKEAIEAAKNVAEEPVKAGSTVVETQVEASAQTTEAVKAEAAVQSVTKVVDEKKQIILDKRARAQKGMDAVKMLQKMEHGIYHVGVHGTVVEVKLHPTVKHLKVTSLVYSEHLDLRNKETGMPEKVMMSEGIMNEPVMPETLESKSKKEYKLLTILHEIIWKAFSKIKTDTMSAAVEETPMDVSVIAQPAPAPVAKAVDVVFSKEEALPLGSVKMTSETVGLFYVRVGNGRAYEEAQFGRLTLTEVTGNVKKDHPLRKILSIHGAKVSIALQACYQRPSEKEVVDLTNFIDAKRFLHQLAYEKCTTHAVKTLPVMKATPVSQDEEAATRPRHVEQVPEGTIIVHAMKKLLGLDQVPV